MTNSFEREQTDFSQDWGIEQSTQSFRPGLYIVATPIGNLRDVTLRALDVLSRAEVVYCEDTRVTQKLFSAYGLTAKLERCDEHTEARRVNDIVRQVNEGKIVALVSDAGTPAISDPGAVLVAACRDAGIDIIPIPGPSAMLAALSASGLVNGHFVFLGFLESKSGARRQILNKWQQSDIALVLFEAPQRVEALLQDIQSILGERDVTIARELTKRHERFYHGTPETLLRDVTDENFKGEVVIVIHPGQTTNAWNDDAIDTALKMALGKVNLKEAVAQVTAQSGLSRKIVYARALALKDD